MTPWEEAVKKAKADQQFDELGCEPKKLKIPPSTYPGVKTSGWGRRLTK